jgi:hypothetical protein
MSLLPKSPMPVKDLPIFFAKKSTPGDVLPDAERQSECSRQSEVENSDLQNVSQEPIEEWLKNEGKSFECHRCDQVPML